MSKQYQPNKIEPKWQKKWAESGIYFADDTTNDTSKKPKSYVLIEFPYPSGERLHVGHARSYCALDTVARLRRMCGMNVLYPIGWDAFGLPAENYAIKTGIHPSITTAENIANSKSQLLSWGISFDWSREISTTDPRYYKWTQWIFLQLYKAGLAYRAEIAVNWCPSCKINLANEEVIDGKCERCGHDTERRMQKQWLLRITKYADRLLDDLENVNYRNDIKVQQVSWIGRKKGVNITYRLLEERARPSESPAATAKKKGQALFVKCFTTRPDTNFGAMFVVLSPEHELSSIIATKACQGDISTYVADVMKKSELERISADKKKTGVFTGRYVINPLNGEKMPVYIGDFVLSSVGTGAIVGVPGHDRRDFEFAQVFGLPVKRVVVGPNADESEIDTIDQVYEGEGKAINSGFLNGLDTGEAIRAATARLVELGVGEPAVSYHLRDWVFSRQHYWGEPIPIIHCEKCGETAVDEGDLPVKLPHVEKYQPTDTGESPLAAVKEWVNVVCPKCGSAGRRETDTMPNWAGSSWYFIRYIDPNNDKVFASPDKLKKWLPVDWYNGGMEHTNLHLLYSRFWHKFLYDQGLVPTKEPYAKRTAHGVVLGPDGAKMSKSRGNVINPDDIVGAFGADTLRLYMMFIGPFDHQVAWSNESIQGVRRFLNKAWLLSSNVIDSKREESGREVMSILNRLVKKVGDDVESMKFNTVVSAYMECVNELSEVEARIGRDAIKLFAKCLAPCAPHMAEEMWEMAGGEFSIHTQPWPQYDAEALKEGVVTIIVQIDGKVKGTIEISTEEGEDEEKVREKAISALNMRDKYQKGLDEAKIVFVEGRLINFVTKCRHESKC
ncbi:leucine--tRNA ligase [candidate division WWE3 bacterium]|nr:leucine--tRNA ligase [candidate division WWE3 bacterium]